MKKQFKLPEPIEPEATKQFENNSETTERIEAKRPLPDEKSASKGKNFKNHVFPERIIAKMQKMSFEAFSRPSPAWRSSAAVS